MGCVRVCAGVQECAGVCASVRGCAQVCTGVHGYVWVWDVFSEFLLENRVPTSADFNRYPIRIFFFNIKYFAFSIVSNHHIFIIVLSTQ